MCRWWLVLVTAAGVARVAAYQRGDAVPTLVRTQHAGWRTPWTEVLRHEMPKFRQKDEVSLKPLSPHDGFVAGEHLKLSLAFADSKFIVPWTTMYDGQHHHLTRLAVTFLFTGSDIVQVKWNGEYGDIRQESQKKKGKGKAKGKGKGEDDDDDDAVGPNPSQANKVITLQYDWAEVVEHDVEAGLVTLFSLTLMVFLVIMCRFCATMDDPETATPAAKRR